MESDWDSVIGVGCLFGWLITGTYVMYACKMLDMLLWCCGKEYDAKIIDRESKMDYSSEGEPTRKYHFTVEYVINDKCKVNTRIKVDDDEYSKYHNEIQIGYLSCFPCIKRLKSGKSCAKVCEATFGVHVCIICWFGLWICFSYFFLSGYIGIIITIGWSIIWWICCCCPLWIYIAQDESQQTYTYIDTASKQNENEDPENPEPKTLENEADKQKDKQEKLTQLQMTLQDTDK